MYSIAFSLLSLGLTSSSSVDENLASDAPIAEETVRVPVADLVLDEHCAYLRDLDSANLSDINTLDLVGKAIKDVTANASGCSCSHDVFTELLAGADDYLLKLMDMPIYGDFIAANKELSTVPLAGSAEARFESTLSHWNGEEGYSVIAETFGPLYPLCEYKKFSEFQIYTNDFSGNTMMYGLAFHYRYLQNQSEVNPSEQSLLQASKVVLNRAASVFASFFTEEMLYSPGYLTNNFFRSILRSSRDDLIGALAAARDLYPKVSDSGKAALLRYAGALRLGFTSVEGSGGSMINELRKVLILEDGGTAEAPSQLTAPFVAEIRAIIAKTAVMIRKGQSPDVEDSEITLEAAMDRLARSETGFSFAAPVDAPIASSASAYTLGMISVFVASLMVVS